jgi:hypothetical protein
MTHAEQPFSIKKECNRNDSVSYESGNRKLDIPLNIWRTETESRVPELLTQTHCLAATVNNTIYKSVILHVW